MFDILIYLGVAVFATWLTLYSAKCIIKWIRHIWYND